MTRLKAFSMPKGVNFSFTCMHTPPAYWLTQHSWQLCHEYSAVQLVHVHKLVSRNSWQ